MSRRHVQSGGPWESVYAYSRAIAVGDACFISGTTDAGADGESMHPGDAAAQARASWAIVEGALPGTAITRPVDDLLRRFHDDAAAAAALYHGPLVLRLRINPAGAVADCAILLDRVMHPDPGHADWEALRARLIERFQRAVFPAAASETVLTLPVGFGSRPTGAS